MAQGQIKKKKSTTTAGGAGSSSTRRSSTLGPRKGARNIAPKKASLVRQRKMTKKLSSGLITKTERTLAERAGHLELLAGGKKQRQQAQKTKDQEKGRDPVGKSVQRQQKKS
ncbi:hypothetical protein Egran_01986 [Elaphomyces granulatus]|uniref:Uncharacterized protein n=1 Tax=Elaphomyces granulatus TaxID=519963 RepID=A0A232M1J8_9EURO|nr:hypothetical protein Egran_01986 [Elaphomyces granulatus]